MSTIRVCPRTFDCDWREEFQALGFKVPEKIEETSYTPVNHSPMPFSVAIDMKRKRAVKRFVGVIPNATYQGHIYRWNEFCDMIREETD